MTERERLEELLMASPTDFDGNRNVGVIADYLIANGVLFPPVKIGQELWDIHYNKPRKWEVCYIGYNGKEWFIDLRYFKNKNGFVTIQIESRYLNRLYFLTKEEAEKTLEE